MKRSSFKEWCFLALLLFLFPWAYAQVDAGYEADKRSGSTQCPNPTGSDRYGGINSQGNPLGGFGICQCTSYVAYRLRLNNVKIHKNQTNADELFVNWNWGNTSIHWSDAYKWRDSVGTVGVREDQYPAVGSVAHWNDSAIPGTGHVAYVQHLFTHPNDGRITGIGVMEYNWKLDKKYLYRRIGYGRGKGNTGYPTSFLHFEEKGTDADQTNATCVAGLDKRPSTSNRGSFCWKHTSNSDASCGNASAYYYYDYRTCQKYTVTSSTTPNAAAYCGEINASPSSYPGYTAKISGSNFPESIAPSANGTDFASCPAGSKGIGNSREVSGRLEQPRAKFWRGLDNALN
ncbi:MAG: CHAP domain-containing protein [Undibacterium sp.]